MILRYCPRDHSLYYPGTTKYGSPIIINFHNIPILDCCVSIYIKYLLENRRNSFPWNRFGRGYRDLSSNSRIRTMAAPVVPMSEARKVPINSSTVFTRGVPASEPPT